MELKEPHRLLADVAPGGPKIESCGMGPKRGCQLEQVGHVPKEPHRVARGSSTRMAKINVYWGHGRQPDSWTGMAGRLSPVKMSKGKYQGSLK